jgi:hypothetical protein
MKTLSVALKDDKWSFSNCDSKIKQEQFSHYDYEFFDEKGYWKFITGDEKKIHFLKSPTHLQIHVNKTWHEKITKLLY